jgi:hypothetical protein
MYLWHSLFLKLQRIKLCWSLPSCPFKCIGFIVLLPSKMWAFVATWSCCLGPLSWVEVRPNLPKGKVKEWSFSTCLWRNI